MRVVFLVGRVLFVAYFIYAGLQKLMNVAATAAFYAGKLQVPAALVDAADAVERTVGLSAMQTLVLIAGTIELAAAILIALNVATRAMAVILMVFTVLGILYVHDFWNMAGEARTIALTQAMLYLSLLGGLALFVATGPAVPGNVEPRADV